MKNAPDLDRGAGNQSEVNSGSFEDSSVSTPPASPLQGKTCLFLNGIALRRARYSHLPRNRGGEGQEAFRRSLPHDRLAGLRLTGQQIP
jgi:hypothetical protein